MISHAEGLASLTADYDVIQDPDIHKLPRCDKAIRHIDVILGRRAASTRMIVHQDDAGRVRENGALEDIRYICQR